jgi:hypothetical protein
MSKKIVVRTDFKPDYKKCLYVCGKDEKTGNLNIIQVDKTSNAGKIYKTYKKK